MKKITKVYIENFQSHSKTEIDFSGFTGIIGDTNSGKSAIPRAIAWCLYNIPAGDRFIFREKGEQVATRTALVRVDFSDGTYVEHLKGPKKHSYVLGGKGDPVLLENFGMGPSEEVMDFHGMKIISFPGGELSLNIGNQMDPPFFVAESPVARAIIVGRLAGTEFVDMAIKNTSSDLRSRNQRLTSIKGRIEEIELSLTKYDSIENMVGDISLAEESLKRNSDLQKTIEEIRLAFSESQIIFHRLEEIRAKTSSETDVNWALSSAACTKDKISLIKDTEKLLKEVFKNREEVEKILPFMSGEIEADIFLLDNLINKTKAILEFLSVQESILGNIFISSRDKDSAEASLTNMYKVYIETCKSCEKARLIVSVLGEISNLTKALLENSDVISQKSEEYEASLKSAGMCPTCLRKY